ncbi:substrate-binding domain-containing protein [Paenibacillus sp. RUD330]|uniref:substrate-binding domain-containing protein n=1 Tax=Paenibacillus sp. RUD330 TaxID=2023772 RepID=UPI0012FD19DB|nr:substrate-binding domain-containing protein [Paenibacillus sp. RUD330]ASS68904.2 sugar ABC transporter substrate-binding protein [Paenibacillus sp. RUD330]
MNRRMAAAGGWLALLMLVGAASGCAGAASKEKQPAEAQIALIAPQRSGALADSIRLGAEAAAKEYGSQLLYMDANVSDSGEEGQLKAAQRAIAQGASVLLLDPDSEQQLRLIAEEAGKAGASVVTLNDSYPVEGIASSISINNREAGRMAGEAMAELLHGRGIVSLLGSDSEAPGYEQRELGVVEALSGHKEITVHTGYSCGSSPDGCAEAARLLMEQADGVVALQEQGVLSTAQEAVKRGLSSRVKIVGFGSEVPQLELLQDGIIDILVVQSGFNAGYLGMQQAHELLEGGHVDRTVTLDTKVVNPDSMFWMDNQKLLFPFVK